MIEFIRQKLDNNFSPEQIENVMEKSLGVRLSHPRIYQYIEEDRKRDGRLYQKLRIANGKKRRKKVRGTKKKVQIQGRTGIEIDRLK